MKTENLTKACDSFAFFFAELREAHTDAVTSGTPFAEAALYSLIGDAAKMEEKIDRIRETAHNPKVPKKKKRR